MNLSKQSDIAIGLALGSGSSRGWAHIGLLEFHRAKEAIQEEKNCVKRMLPEIESIMDLP